MAQNYEIDIKRFNGQDYDTLLPTPASHASTHQAGGSDPLTLQAGNYGALSIPTSAYQNTSITRAKLAQDALYSPIRVVQSDSNVVSSDVGATIRTGGNASAITVTLTQDVSLAMPIGAVIAFLPWVDSTMKIAFDGVKVAVLDQAKTYTSPTFTLTRYGMVAIEKITSDSRGEYWLLTGPAEVVE